MNDAGVTGEHIVNRYKLNNSKVEVLHYDLAAKSTVDSLIIYALKSRKKQIEEWRREKTRYPEEAEPPVAEVMVGLGCDGDPAEQALRLQFVKAALPSKDQ